MLEPDPLFTYSLSSIAPMGAQFIPYNAKLVVFTSDINKNTYKNEALLKIPFHLTKLVTTLITLVSSFPRGFATLPVLHLLVRILLVYNCNQNERLLAIKYVNSFAPT